MAIWNKIEITTINNETELFKNADFKMRGEGALICIEDESGKGACYPENNVKKILCERDENTKKKIGGVVGATKEILE